VHKLPLAGAWTTYVAEYTWVHTTLTFTVFQQAITMTLLFSLQNIQH
jgi:hypothetical protein